MKSKTNKQDQNRLESKMETTRNGYTFQNSGHTDLAVELKEELEQQSELSGVEVRTRKYQIDGVLETRIKIVNETGEQALGKPIGNYITLELQDSCIKDNLEEVGEIIANSLQELKQDAEFVLVVGLGNKSVTPDAMGPLVVEHLQVNRHYVYCGLEKEAERTMSAISPGVMAQTGMETVEIIKGLVNEIHPDVVIVVDALAARSSERLNRTIQICDTGISPGAGVGNNRQKMDRETLGVDVIAIGVPTVISVPTIVCDAMQQFLTIVGAKQAGEIMEQFTPQEQYELVGELVRPYFADLFVTPKNIDELVLRMSQCIALGTNAYIKGGREELV